MLAVEFDIFGLVFVAVREIWWNSCQDTYAESSSDTADTIFLPLTCGISLGKSNYLTLCTPSHPILQSLGSEELADLTKVVEIWADSGSIE